MQQFEDLLSSIPPRVREQAALSLSFSLGGETFEWKDGFGETDLRRLFRRLASKNRTVPVSRLFVGAGTYCNPIPAVVHQLALRSEFLSAVSPVEPEVAQGTLQWVFEYQTLLARLTGFPAATACRPDGISALTTALRLLKRRASDTAKHLHVASSLPEDVRAAVRTAFAPETPEPTDLPWREDGTVELPPSFDEKPPFAVLVGYPNGLGLLEPLDRLKERLPKGTALVAWCGDPLALALFEPPGRLGADLLAGDMQQFGSPLSYGGQRSGFVAGTRDLVDCFGGWLVQELSDQRYGQLGSGSGAPGLNALRAHLYLCALGTQGLAELATQAHSLHRYLARELLAVGIPERFPGAVSFRESLFVVPNLAARWKRLVDRGFAPGLLSTTPSGVLLACHPDQRREDLDLLVEGISNG